jgi:hypothetical protein
MRIEPAVRVAGREAELLLDRLAMVYALFGFEVARIISVNDSRNE